MRLYERYCPLTSRPFRNEDQYVEIEPCDALKPFIRCFWGTKGSIKNNGSAVASKGIIIPDTCVDIIFRINYTQNRIESSFCGINDTAFCAFSADASVDVISTFAIRFYAWSAILFSEETMKDTRNRAYDADIHFEKLKNEIQPELFDFCTIEQRARITEKYLLKNFYGNHENPLFMSAIWQIMEHQGNLKTLEMAKELNISSRQMERVFYENMGITPKKAASLIRYQYLWQEVCFNPKFNVLDAVYKYGYVDQAHLLHNFKKFHGLSLSDAIQYARTHVDFLQDKSLNIK